MASISDIPAPRTRKTELPRDPTIASVARTFVRSVLNEWDLSGLEPDACLLASELVTNGLRYGGGSRWLKLRAVHGHLRIEVADHEALRAPQRQAPSTVSEGGRGLALVETMSTSWGTTHFRLRRGKMVWCELQV